MTHFWALVIGYIFGNFLFAMIVGKIFLKKNPTQFGSKNPGTANMGAVFGKKWGILTCIGDLAKAIVAFAFVFALFKNRLDLAYTALGLMAGHCYPIWNQFKGGKGVAVAAIAIFIYDLPAGVISLLLALVVLIMIKNLTIPPQMFMILFSVYLIWGLKDFQSGIIFLIITLIMAIRFWPDTVDFFQGNGKKVDVLYSIKKKLRSSL